MTTIQSDALTYKSHDSRGEATLHTIQVVKYHDGRPFAVITDHGYFDFEYCKRDHTLSYLDTGGGLHENRHFVSRYTNPVPPYTQIWTAPGVQLVDWADGRCKQIVPVDEADLLARGYQRLAEPLLLCEAHSHEQTRNPFEAADAADGHHEYCSICDDMLPDDNLCAHLYLPDGGDPLGVGANEPSQESVFAAFDWLITVEQEQWSDWCFRRRAGNVRDALHLIEGLLLSGDFKRSAQGWKLEDEVYYSFRDDDDDEAAKQCWEASEDGIGWLTTLGPDTPAANAKTLRWLMEWRLARPERERDKERKRLIAALQKHATTKQRGKKILKALGVTGKNREELDAVPLETLRAVLAAQPPLVERAENSR